MTTRAALYNTIVPKTVIQDRGDGEIEFDISEDVEEWERIEGWDKVPVAITLNKVRYAYYKLLLFFLLRKNFFFVRLDRVILLTLLH
jgi:hypothetical protein